MRDYVILTDSTCDLSSEQAEKLEVKVLPIKFTLNNDMYLINKDFDAKEFYNLLRHGVQASTTQINFSTFIDVFSSYLDQGLDVIYISFSSQLSSTYDSAKLAVQELKSKYPKGKLIIKDSLCACMGEGLLVYYASKKKSEGLTIEELSNWIDENKLKICHLFTVDDLHFLKRGGRISPATAVVGTMLNVKPVLHVSNEGTLEPIGKTRGRRASLLNMVERMKDMYDDSSDGTVFIAHADCLEDANFLKGKVEKELNVRKVIINYIGPVIGAHVGPGALTLFFTGNYR